MDGCQKHLGEPAAQTHCRRFLALDNDQPPKLLLLLLVVILLGIVCSWSSPQSTTLLIVNMRLQSKVFYPNSLFLFVNCGGEGGSAGILHITLSNHCEVSRIIVNGLLLHTCSGCLWIKQLSLYGSWLLWHRWWKGLISDPAKANPKAVNSEVCSFWHGAP